MSTPEATPSRRLRIRRRTAFWLGLVVVLVIYPLLVIALPWAVSLMAPRYGWTENGLSAWNWLGLALVAAGLAGLAWVFGTMFAQFPRLPEVVELDEGEHFLTATAHILITHGPFALSRNPMFLSGLIVWLGWAIFYGSIAVGIAILLFGAFSNYLKVPQEERGLEARFGDEYRAYKRRVPRWLGIPRRG
jgi:protein-S-isoprenylcysteine O-methyltransferase Ste14